jgi:hypothetical protein
MKKRRSCWGKKKGLSTLAPRDGGLMVAVATIRGGSALFLLCTVLYSSTAQYCITIPVWVFQRRSALFCTSCSSGKVRRTTVKLSARMTGEMKLRRNERTWMKWMDGWTDVQMGWKGRLLCAIIASRVAPRVRISHGFLTK